MHEGWLSNSWLVADRPGGRAVVIDTGGAVAPLARKIEALRLDLTHVLCTHHHVDHVAGNADYVRRFGAPICGPARERDWFDRLDVELAGGDELVTGDLHVRALHTPGHTRGMLAFLVNQERVFTGDTLFRRTVGGTRAPGHTTLADLRRSVMDVLMPLARDMPVHPGHTESTTIGEEWEGNPFVRIWRGIDRPEERPCRAFDEPATLILRAPDYDGGTKCWIRTPEGREDIVPGSRVRDV